MNLGTLLHNLSSENKLTIRKLEKLNRKISKCETAIIFNRQCIQEYIYIYMQVSLNITEYSALVFFLVRLSTLRSNFFPCKSKSESIVPILLTCSRNVSSIQLTSSDNMSDIRHKFYITLYINYKYKGNRRSDRSVIMKKLSLDSFTFLGIRMCF